MAVATGERERERELGWLAMMTTASEKVAEEEELLLPIHHCYCHRTLQCMLLLSPLLNEAVKVSFQNSLRNNNNNNARSLLW